MILGTDGPVETETQTTPGVGLHSQQGCQLVVSVPGLTLTTAVHTCRFLFKGSLDC